MDVRESASLWKNLPNFSGVSVLVVDDDADGRELLRDVLRACRATVLEADNIGTARGYIENLKVDLIVSDIALPDEDGPTFVRWLRERSSDNGGVIPVIAVTGYYDGYAASKVGGWAAYFQKPVDIDEFVRTIAGILNVWGSAKAST
jgi:CheY-like chemotaxis protein